MKLQILNKEGKKTKDKDTFLFEEPVRLDIISRIVEAEKVKQAYSNTFRAGMDRSASGNVRHLRHAWKSDRGRGMARMPKMAMSRRGTQFNWVAAIVPFVRGGRRAHPPKGSVGLRKINKRENQKALLSSLSYTADNNALEKKYARIEKVEGSFPLVVEDKVIELKTRDFLDSLKKILGDLYTVAIQKKSIRAGKGKMRGRKYKQNAGLLLVIGNDENKKVNGIEVVKVNDLSVSDLASGGARLTIFTEKAIEALENVLGNDKKVQDKKDDEKVRVDVRKVRKEIRKNKARKVKKTKDKSEEVKKDA